MQLFDRLLIKKCYVDNIKFSEAKRIIHVYTIRRRSEKMKMQFRFAYYTIY